ncbi:hemK methyltransferase family member 2-like [Limulus polyphemus]|uniref:HemK methyltransferase family member 2-like n=1 Tax=Limulus polyphemus TaxID=6850 RepID=A0ABM1B7Q8_LIMPO|nr:hemK methyltransferase family member 2-like [Limulus polyphemus]
MNTPVFDFLKDDVYKSVYEPSEDSFLLIDALENDLELIRKLNPSICLEVGSGSGVVISAVSKVFPSAYCLATDINHVAALATKKMAETNKVTVEPVVTDLTSAVRSRLLSQVDLLVFNPPYVVTPSEEVGTQSLQAAWAGGIKGRQVMDRFFPFVPQLLSTKGLFYIVVLKDNNPDEITEFMFGQGLKMNNVLSRRCGIEHLSVLRFENG